MQERIEKSQNEGFGHRQLRLAQGGSRLARALLKNEDFAADWCAWRSQ
ncbi:hypothetical protein A2U01_0045146, partial [Trifolium medium]|nr:hypothetical protein [Trifolium medium]